MRRIQLCLTALLFGMSVMAQGPTAPVAPGQEPPRGITLLPGYKHELKRTVDSVDGRIWKDQGLEIHYNRGLGTGSIVDREVLNEVWSKYQTVGTNIVRIAMTKDRVLLVTITPSDDGQPSRRTNFWANVHNDEEISDMLLMVMASKP